MTSLSRKLVMALVIGTFALSGCHFQQQPEPAKITDTPARKVETISVDNYMVTGRHTVTFDTIPRKVMVVGLEESEMALAFCPKENILALYGFYDLKDFVKPQYKKRLEEIPILSRGEINVENIITMQPDLIIAEQCSFIPSSLRSTALWNSRGIKTYVPVNTNNPSKHLVEESIEAEYQYISDFGKIFDKESLANDFIKDAKATLSFFKSRSHNFPPSTVLIVEQFGKDIASYDKTKLGGKIVTELGGRIPETAPLISKEDLRVLDPDVLFVVCSDGDHGECLKRFIAAPFTKQLSAVQHDRIYSIELETIYAPGLRIKDGIERIGLSLYPDLREEYRKTQVNTINPSYERWLTNQEDLTTTDR